MGLAVDGLVSGLDTTALINSLMAVEAIPQTQLKNKVSSAQSFISALQGLNTKVATLAEQATKTAKPAALDLYSATSSSTTVTLTLASGAAAGQLDLVVDKLAQTQQSVSAQMTAWPDSPPTLTIVGTDGVAHKVTATSTSLDDVVSAINTSDSGVTATKVAVGGGNFRLQFTSDTIGADGAFTIHQGSDATAPQLGVTLIQGAQDAQITIWAGTPAAQAITSKTNTFTGVLPGVSITATAASVNETISLTIARDDTAIGTVASDLVAALNGIFSEIAAKSSVTTSTNSSGKASAKGGVFTSDSTVRDVNQKILSAASMPIDGRSPSEFGISITKTGTMEFDAEKFAAAMAKDPAATQAVVQTIAGRVAEAAQAVSDKYDGMLTSKITGQESELKGLGSQIDDWDRRLSSRRSTLERTYAALEVALSKLNSQSSYMASQLAGLPGSNS